MKKLLTFSGTILLLTNSFFQNIGIGLTNPTRAKLGINGVEGNTVALFGGY